MAATYKYIRVLLAEQRALGPEFSVRFRSLSRWRGRPVPGGACEACPDQSQSHIMGFLSPTDHDEKHGLVMAQGEMGEPS